jgi:hypothetical protein
MAAGSTVYGGWFYGGWYSHPASELGDDFSYPGACCPPTKQATGFIEPDTQVRRDRLRFVAIVDFRAGFAGAQR